MYDQGGDMDIRIDKNVVEFTPESEKETKQLEGLWRINR